MLPLLVDCLACLEVDQVNLAAGQAPQGHVRRGIVFRDVFNEHARHARTSNWTTKEALWLALKFVFCHFIIAARQRFERSTRLLRTSHTCTLATFGGNVTIALSQLDSALHGFFERPMMPERPHAHHLKKTHRRRDK